MKKDCFAFKGTTEHPRCSALSEMLCLRRNCPFYKSFEVNQAENEIIELKNTRNATATLGRRVHILRLQKKITQLKLATELGVSESHISRIENNEALPDVMLLWKIAKFFNTTTDFCLGVSDGHY